ncbi:MAG: NAD(+) synthase [Bacteroidetes bacterium]|nr:MAG: NAD(+) synthase [Bacteroidota bacterium]
MSFRPNKVIPHIVSWLDSYAGNANSEGFVIGVSGGIDSAVTATLCLMTGRPVYIVDMPIHQASTELSRSLELRESLSKRFDNTNIKSISLTQTYEAIKSVLSLERNSDLALANTRARLRMTALYALAAERNALVVGTGNKIEDFGVGFFTKYGDGGVDLSPIADLVKSEVFALGHALGVPVSILEAAPTDGLWGDERNDEDQIGASYPELERAMAFISNSGNPSTLEGRPLEVYNIYTKLHAQNRHKMLPIPVCTIPDDLK